MRFGFGKKISFAILTEKLDFTVLVGFFFLFLRF